jgi:hypothetical protein
MVAIQFKCIDEETPTCAAIVAADMETEVCRFA